MDEREEFQWHFYGDYVEVFAACVDLETLASWGRELKGNEEVNETTMRVLREKYRLFRDRISNEVSGCE